MTHHKQSARNHEYLTNLSDIAFEEVGTKNFDFTARVIEKIGKTFAKFNQPDCAGLKENLLAMEDRMPGRVLLSDFYAKGLYGSWRFLERVEYLRDLGALDETQPSVP